MRSKKRVVDGLAIPISSEIQDIMAELSAADHDPQTHSSSSSDNLKHRHSHSDKAQQFVGTQQAERRSSRGTTQERATANASTVALTSSSGRVEVESFNVSSSESSSSDSVDLQAIERRLKSLVQSAMNYEQK
jgi:hypothetical protein